MKLKTMFKVPNMRKHYYMHFRQLTPDGVYANWTGFVFGWHDAYYRWKRYGVKVQGVIVP